MSSPAAPRPRTLAPFEVPASAGRASIAWGAGNFSGVGFSCTPLSNQHYLNATRGNIYGIEKSPKQVGPLGFRPTTEFEGLYLCGQSTISHGVAGVTASGMNAAKAVLNARTRDILTQKSDGPLFLQAEDTSTWPEHLKRKMERGEVPREDEEMEV
jgi:hypothetical protein